MSFYYRIELSEGRWKSRNRPETNVFAITMKWTLVEIEWKENLEFPIV